MNLREREGIKGNRFAVTGGLGFLGSALCLDLVKRGAEEVRSLDIRPSSPCLSDLQKNGVHCIRGDVSQKQDVEKALQGVNCVFHLASYGNSSKEMLQGDRLEEVNLYGTCNILDACHEFGVERLVYMSTYQAVFGGEEIINGDESLPYYPIDEHIDPYGCSKLIAEYLILKRNIVAFISILVQFVLLLSMDLGKRRTFQGYSLSHRLVSQFSELAMQV